ncbi:acetylglutamate kinase [Thalassotalea psychrophila]|uniref:Acetylglutamate kinase n=1 Tax=Thalassotalea psychrophila TaxID=3065647 RepID=A0ABY9TTF5_9GAMM|nr:acetylglutamate kinase [Colwelliaceae bacterium SQ149]
MSTPLVIKIGGAIMESPQALIKLFKVVKTLQDNKQSIIVVHGGGCVADELLAKAGYISKKVNGLRVSEPEHMAIITGALAGTVNKALVASANTVGLSAVGLALHDGQMIKCTPAEEFLGCVGVPSANDDTFINALVNGNSIAIISSIGSLDNGQLVNVNADDAAVAISQLVNGNLILLTDVAGVKGASGEYLDSLNYNDAKQLIKQGVIDGGMIAKVNAAFTAATQLRRSIAVASWKTPEQLITLQQGNVFGTRIEPNC